MKKKKGFTLVELLVVIAILAILATVSIIGYTSFIKKANKSNDEAVVAQINLILQASEQEGKPNTLHDALQEVFANGFDVTKLTPTSNGYHYVYHIDKNRFELVESLGDGNSNDWIFVDAKDATNRGYSVYLVSDNREDKAAELVVNSGIDVGSLTITSIKYESNIGQNAIIRTNSLSTSLTIDAVNDTIMHYELANSVNIIRTAYSSYHEKGITSYIECASGKVVVEAEGKVNTVVLTDVKSAGDKAAVVKNNGGEVEHVYATTNDVATANNNAETEHDTLKVEVIAEGGNVLATTEAEAATIIEEKKEAAIESSKSFVQLSCAHKFDGDTCVYCHISKKKLPEISKEELGGFVKVEENKYQITSKNGLGLFVKYINANDTSKIPNGSTIELAVNIDLKDNYWEPISYYLGNYTFDGCGHTIYNMTTSTEFNTRKDVGFFCNAQGWTIKNLNFDGARVEGINHVAVIVGSGMCTKIENCSVKNATVIASVYNNDDGDKVGAICGYLSGEWTAWVRNCTVENVTIEGYRDVGGIVGYAECYQSTETNKGIADISGNKIENVKIINDQTNNYKNYTTDAQFDVNTVVGELHTYSTQENNIVTNVTIEIKK